PINYITSDGVVHLRNLNLAPGSPPAVITITATASCTDPGSLAWSSKAKQSNNFSGTPGNNFSPYPLLTDHSATPRKLPFATHPGARPVNYPTRHTKWGGVMSPATMDAMKVILLAGDGTTQVDGSGTVTITGLGGAGCASLSIPPRASQGPG